MTRQNFSYGSSEELLSERNLSEMLGNETVQPPYKGIVDAATVQLVSNITYTYILPVIFVFGTFGNVLSLFVLCAEKKKNTTTMILIALTLSDLGVTIITFARRVSYIIQYFDEVLARNYRTAMLGHMNLINNIFSIITSLITTLISTERLVAVLFPLKVNVIFTQQRVLVILVLIYIVTLFLILPFFFTADIKWVPSPLTNASTAVYFYTKFFLDNRRFWSIYANGVVSFVLVLAPRVIVGFNTAAIIIKLKRVKAWRSDMAQSSNQMNNPKDTKLTYMLVTLCGIFIVCSLPTVMRNVLTVVASESFHYYGKNRNFFNLLTPIIIVTKCFNSSINFVVYIVLNKKFARTFKQIIGCRNEGEG